ncbi:MAG: phytanoyl-CoA dioxygenase family protein, partial [Halieaceae bacterium]|nr:phytanoyl-CoA dioxygenase family protein [Halieaceae bacterium]
MPTLAHFSPTDSQQAMLEALKRDGAIIVDNLMSTEQVNSAVNELDPYVQATDNGQDDFSGRLTTRTGGLVARSAQCRDLIQHPLILSLCKTFLSPYCERVQLHLGQVIRIKPGQPTQPIHRDRWAWGTHLAHVEPQFNTIWALTDFTEENGATQVVPGSTGWPDDRAAEEAEITKATMRAGSVLMYSGSVFHGGGKNRSQSDRWGLNITYT